QGDVLAVLGAQGRVVGGDFDGNDGGVDRAGGNGGSRFVEANGVGHVGQRDRLRDINNYEGWIVEEKKQQSACYYYRILLLKCGRDGLPTWMETDTMSPAETKSPFSRFMAFMMDNSLIFIRPRTFPSRLLMKGW